MVEELKRTEAAKKILSSVKILQGLRAQTTESLEAAAKLLIEAEMDLKDTPLEENAGLAASRVASLFEPYREVNMKVGNVILKLKQDAQKIQNPPAQP